MRAPWRILALALASAGLACPSGYRLEAVDGAEPAITSDTWRALYCARRALEDAGPAWAAARRPHLHCAAATAADDQELCVTAPGRRGSGPTVPPGAKLQRLVSFVHLSDAQLKEHSIHVRGPSGNAAQYDGLHSGMRRDALLERHDDAALLATVVAINEMAVQPATSAADLALLAPLPTTSPGFLAPLRPSFVIHTGDSVDAGMFSELLQFIGVLDQLRIPWFNVVGNHDNLFFGTFPGEEVSGMNVVAPYVPIGSTDRFMRYHSLAGVFDPTLPYPADRGDDHQPSVLGGIASVDNRENPDDPDSAALGTRYHGFERACPVHRRKGPAGNELCPEANGYYAFNMRVVGGQRTIRALVLNTAEVLPSTIGEGFRRGSQGLMLPPQLAWLRSELATRRGADRPLFMVFGHHGLDAFLEDEQGAELASILLGDPHVLAYVSGHEHVDGVVERPRPLGPPLWELSGGSTLVYPQLGHLVELLEDPDARRVYLRYLSFRQVLGDQAEGLRKRGRTDPSVACEPPPGCAPLSFRQESLCQRLADRAWFARAGGHRDEADTDRREEREAVEASNGVMLVYQERP